MVNRFDGRCSVCDSVVLAGAGVALKVGSKWQVRCSADADVQVDAPVTAPAVAHLTEEQFQAAEASVTALIRSRDPRAAAVSADWESAIRLPQVKWQQRQDRLSAIAAVASKHGLVMP